MSKSQSFPWIEPLALASALGDGDMALLYSGVQASYSGRYSYLAHGLLESLEGNDFSALDHALAKSQQDTDNIWFGYLGYGLKNCLEHLPEDGQNWLMPSPLCMRRFNYIYRFDHETRSIDLCSYNGAPPMLDRSVKPTGQLPKVSELTSTMSDKEYLTKAAKVISSIQGG